MVSNLLISPTPKFGPSSKRVTKELTPISIHYSSNELLFSSIELNHFICWIKLLILKLILSSKMNNNKESKLSHQTTRRETNHFQLSCKGCFMLNFIPTIDKNPFMLMYLSPYDNKKVFVSGHHFPTIPKHILGWKCVFCGCWEVVS